MLPPEKGRTMKERYQVFVSSTYDDLREERQEIIKALLELNCIPSGMEFFPASDVDQWSLIKPVIDDCDYFIVVIGGCYGSTGPDGKSYTQMEYEYALAAHKPVLAFLHHRPEELPPERVDQGVDLKDKLENFRELAKKQRMCKFWKSPQELGRVVNSSITRIIEEKPAIGWIRANARKVVYQDNIDVFAELSDHIRHRKTQRALLIQYAGRNVLPVLQQLWRNTDAEINLYVISPESRYVVGDQAKKIRDFEANLPKELTETNTRAVLRYWQYDVPASPRIVVLDDSLIALGPYLYQARDPEARQTMDVCGGEIPIMLLRNGDPNFDLVWGMADNLIRNWSSAGLSRERWSMDKAQRLRRANYGEAGALPGA